jgi:IS30 family transposase
VTTTTTQAARTRQRAKVRRLAEQGASNRTIAVKAGVSESTVRRWRKDDAPAAQEAASPGASPGAPDDVLTVALDNDLRDHLAVLAETGHDAQSAVTLALETIADAYRYAWDYALTERGTPPEIRVRIKGDQLPRGMTW